MNPIDQGAHQASSPPLFNGASVDFFSYQPALQMPQNARMGDHVKIPGLASLNEEQRESLTPFMHQALPRRTNYLGQMPPQSMTQDMQLPTTTYNAPSATYTMPSQDPRLPKKPLPSPERDVDERIAEFRYKWEGVNVNPDQHTIHGDTRSSNTMASNGGLRHEPNLPVAGTKRSRSPENHDNSGSDSADGIIKRPSKRRQTSGRRRLRGNLFQPNHDAQSPQSAQAESEDGDSLFVPAQPRQLKAESSASPESGTPTSNTANKASSARELKQRLAGKSAKAFSRKMNPEKDPENIAIKRMRCVERKQFDDIADVLNKARVDGGLEPTFTANAVYGRFQRIAPRIAALEGQPDFNYRDYLHIPREAKPVPEPNVSLPAMSPQQETLFVEAYEQVKKEVWVYTARKFKEMGGLELSPQQAALKFKSI